MEIKLQLNRAKPTLYTFKEVAELLNIKGLGRNNLMKFLRKVGDLRYDNEINIEDGYYEYTHSYKAIGIVQTVLVTEKGFDRIKEITKDKNKDKDKNDKCK